ncbi:MAG: peptidoglycan DD-metalloendopeptidase family protein, partial [Bacteroidota bacterium]
EEQQQLIEAMENDLQRLKDEYAKMIYHTYKNRNAYSRLMFIFSSENFNQAYKRLQYLRQYAAFRQHQGELIQKTRELLEDKKADLEAIRGEKEGLLQAEQGEIRSLGSERKQQQGTVRKLQKEQKKLKAQLRAAQRKAELLQREIERIIREELARKGKRGSTYDVDTPRARELSSNFTANKGKLPWPVKKGEITGYFGTHPHPILKGIDVKNSGVVISTVSGSKARAVFDGEVSRIIVLKGAGKTVMIRHGEFITIYTNLRDTYVKAGDKVTTEQEIGTLLDQTGTTEIEFQVWRGTDLQNPSLWLYKAR